MDKKVFINKVFTTSDFRETQKIGREFAARLLLDQGVTLPKRGACVIALYGDLGSGKTTFVQGLAEGLGVRKKIISPTFIIVRSYKLEGPNSKLKSFEPRSFYHIDLYRIGDEKSIKGLGIEEIINDPQNIVVIEWAENLESFLPRIRIDIRFFYEKENTRKIAFSSGRQISKD